ncbi:HrpJ domain-containing protein [Prosthecomicrobium sp. N25]|uniref:HrpJ domain-containing protein n=1 Tax=Prosthecomicrobium sp. N25 TaxID=3129254 RepID=UPI003077EC41
MSSIETLRQSLATSNVISPVGAEVMSEVRGDWRGREVALSDSTSKLNDAAEEIGMSVAHRADKKTLGQRQVRQGQGTNIDALQRIADYLDKLPNMPREDALKQLVEQFKTFEELLEKGRSGGGQPTTEDVLAALQQLDPDVTHQFAALEVAREYFETAGASDELHALLDAAKAEFEKGDLARDVRAGFAAAKAADRAAATMETDPGAVRDTYRSMLREQPNLGTLFDGLRRFDIDKNFAALVDAFMSAAGTDLASTGPSSDPDFLHALLTELGKLKRMQSAFEGTRSLLSQTERLMPRSERGLSSPAEMTSRLLNFAAKAAVNLADARGLLGGYEKASLGSQVVLANGLRGLHGDLPDDVMPSLQARQQQVATLGTLLNQLVGAEDEEYEAAEEDKEREREEDARRPSRNKHQPENR